MREEFSNLAEQTDTRNQGRTSVILSTATALAFALSSSAQANLKEGYSKFEGPEGTLMSYNPEEVGEELPELEWGCYGEEVGADSRTDGESNTQAILDAYDDGTCSSDDRGVPPKEDTAVYYCDNLELGGYNDWYLPAKDELEKMYDNRSDLGRELDFSSLWSSTETDSDYARYLHYYGYWRNYLKPTYRSVQCVRSAD